MIIVACTPCNLVIRVMPTKAGDVSCVRELDQLVGRRSSFWPDQYPCPTCGVMAQGFDERTVQEALLAATACRELTPLEAYSAFNGFGFPDEQRCSLETVQRLLMSMPIKKVIGTDVRGSERTLIDALELQDGTKLHFAAGGDGAVIYRITHPTSYAAKVLEEHP
jgi:hypothetical protein